MRFARFVDTVKEYGLDVPISKPLYIWLSSTHTAPVKAGQKGEMAVMPLALAQAARAWNPCVCTSPEPCQTQLPTPR